MPLFTFYPCRADGASTAFETLECLGDTDALDRARRVLAEHQSSVEVIIWEGERCVGALARATNDA